MNQVVNFRLLCLVVFIFVMNVVCYIFYRGFFIFKEVTNDDSEEKG